MSWLLQLTRWTMAFNPLFTDTVCLHSLDTAIVPLMRASRDRCHVFLLFCPSMQAIGVRIFLATRSIIFLCGDIFLNKAFILNGEIESARNFHLVKFVINSCFFLWLTTDNGWLLCGLQQHNNMVVVWGIQMRQIMIAFYVIYIEQWLLPKRAYFVTLFHTNRSLIRCEDKSSR